ncbi:M3 family oligoendopeptidase [Dongia rigui]|uniref:M3 family oligoendopeptidase n=1 Tax=Dongia rigui TaxID=940149 RepID=A0ABU5DZT7_9PROT|nr:M3 family oligoendopeptidase [Dongia rigui]MDY0872790.1 M3 family oligoendopeptidase [Dongia rigui]
MTAAPAKPAEKSDLGTLPNWNLGDLYASPADPTIERDLQSLAALSGEFKRQFEGKLSALGGADLLKALLDFEKMQDLAGRVGSYAQLAYAGNMTDPELSRFQQNISERLNNISVETLFFTLELNKIDDAVLAKQLTHGPLQRYAPWLDSVRAFRPHQLSDEAERLLHEKSISGRQAWNRMFDETMADLRFDVDGKKLTSNEVLNLLTDRDGAKRKAAAMGLSKGLKDNQRIFALVTNTLAKDKEIEDKWRQFKRPVSSRNLANQVEDEVVDALVKAVKQSYPKLSHRYYKLKAKWMGVEALDFWDRNAPLPRDDDRLIPWNEATQSVLDAYHEFSPELAEVGKQFFDKNWIDAPSRPGKDPGAFAHPTVPSAHPYLLLNYHGRTRDVMTLAHELGHGVHQVLAGPQGALLADTPLTLAETASVFGEMLTFQSLLKRESDPAKRRILLAGKVEDMLNTVVRQIAMHNFETVLHDERRAGEVMPERIAEIWLGTQREALGAGVKLPKDSEYGVYWSYIPHFIHVPFYVYAYAFGDCLVNSLYAVYRNASGGFAEKYLDMLKAGGTKRHKELLAPFGLDAADPAFWSKGLGVVSGFIDELEAM